MTKHHRTCFLSAHTLRPMTEMTPDMYLRLISANDTRLPESRTYNGTVNSCETADVYPSPTIIAGIV